MTRSGAGELALLTGAGAAELLQAALAPTGGRLTGWSVRTAEARAGAGATASYRAQVRSDDGERSVLLAATTRALPAGVAPPPGVLRVPCGADRRVLVWRWPQDPWLPALPLAGDAGAVQRLLGDDAPPAGLRLQVRTYRPTRRAVVHGTGAAGDLFLKVVRPGRAAALHERHAVLAAAGLPVPLARASDPRGLLVLHGLPGTPMRDRLRDGGPVPSGEALLALLDRLPAALLGLPRRPSWSDAAAHYGDLLGAALTDVGRPDQAARARALADAVATGLDGAVPSEPVHGDLYEGQLLLGPDGQVTGLLDVDGAGPGRRADDLACLLAHLDVLADRGPGQAPRARALRAAWQAAFAAQVDPRELGLRTAGVVLSLATGPHRVQEQDWPAATVRRLDLAQRALEATGRA